MRSFISILLTLLLSISGFSQDQNTRVVGYLPSYRFQASSKIDYCKLTHLNLCFANPDSEGNITMPSISTVVSEARAENPDIIIMVSLAGAVLSQQQAKSWSDLIDTPSNRPEFIKKIVNYVLANKLDGVDVDLEWHHVTGGYTDFVVELKAALVIHEKLITAALPNQVLFSNVKQEALDAFDFINIMAYDETGPWLPSSPGQHSSYNFAKKGIAFWKNTVGIHGSKLNLGLPFYGYNFVDSTTVDAVTYGEMVRANADYADLNNVDNAYYNGRPLIKSKVALANDEVGGVLIWEIGQDSFDQYSLLTAIHKKYSSLGVSTTGSCSEDSILSINETGVNSKRVTIYPNPCATQFTVSGIYTKQHFVLYDVLGRQMKKGAVSDKERVDISDMPNGVYYLHLKTEQLPIIKK